MIGIFRSIVLINVLVLFSVIYGCKKEEKAVIPTLSTTAISNISSKIAASGGNIISDGGANITARGVCWSKGQTPTISDSRTNDSISGGNFTSLLTNLDSLTTYYVRAYATNSVGTGYGNVLSFQTSAALPIINTIITNRIGQYSAIFGGVVRSSGGASITVSGVCWSTNLEPTITDYKIKNISAKDSFTCFTDSLKPNTKYYVRAFATNSIGTEYGNTITFTTKQEMANTVEDNDGNIYGTVTIGTQTWMKENLRSTKFSDWTEIPNIKDNTTWQNAKTFAYCWYNNDSINYKTPYGAIYNLYVKIANKNVCPSRWHIASDKDWNTLSKYLGVKPGSKMKDTTYWTGPNTGITNSSGFSAVPSGARTGSGTFRNNYGNYPEYNMDLTQFADWWVADGGFMELRRDNSIYVDMPDNYTTGFNIRCVKNQ